MTNNVTATVQAPKLELTTRQREVFTRFVTIFDKLGFCDDQTVLANSGHVGTPSGQRARKRQKAEQHFFNVFLRHKLLDYNKRADRWELTQAGQRFRSYGVG